MAPAADDYRVTEDIRRNGRAGACVRRSGGGAVRATDAVAQLQCQVKIRSKWWLQSRRYCHFVGPKGSSMDEGTPLWIREKNTRRQSLSRSETLWFPIV